MNGFGDLPSLAERVARKRRVLEGWLKDGVPVEKLGGLPRSLRGARVWQDADLGLHAIGSPNDFTTSHPQWGDDVSSIQDSIAALRKRYVNKKLKAATPPAAQTGLPDVALAELKAQKEALLQQWNSSRIEASEATSRAESAERRLIRAKVALDDARMEIARLKRQLERRPQMRVVK